MRWLRRIVATLLLLLFGLVVGALSTHPDDGFGGWLVTALGGLHSAVATTTAGLWRTGQWMFGHPYPTLALLAAACLPGLIAQVIEKIPRRVHKDPQRMFTSDQRRAGADRSGGRCEMEGVFFTRCTRPGEHGDHWFPHSKGGASSMNNFVWACAPCNLAKSAHVPTFWETTRLEWRRRRYFAPHSHMRPGEKVRLR